MFKNTSFWLKCYFSRNILFHKKINFFVPDPTTTTTNDDNDNNDNNDDDNDDNDDNDNNPNRSKPGIKYPVREALTPIFHFPAVKQDECNSLMGSQWGVIAWVVIYIYIYIYIPPTQGDRSEGI